MMITLYKDKKQTSFESKEYKFKLREATPEGFVRTVAVVTVDMAQYLSVEATSCPTLQLMMDADGVETAALMVDLSWSFVKDGKPEDASRSASASPQNTQDPEEEYRRRRTMESRKAGESASRSASPPRRGNMAPKAPIPYFM